MNVTVLPQFSLQFLQCMQVLCTYKFLRYCFHVKWSSGKLSSSMKTIWFSSIGEKTHVKWIASYIKHAVASNDGKLSPPVLRWVHHAFKSTSVSTLPIIASRITAVSTHLTWKYCSRCHHHNHLAKTERNLPNL